MSEKDNKSELEELSLQNKLRAGERDLQQEAFKRKFSEQITRDLPKAEQFVIDFCHTFLHPFVDEEQNSHLKKMGIISKTGMAIIKIINDAFKLATVDRLSQVVKTSQVDGYDASEQKRAWTNDMLFLNMQVEVGAHSGLALLGKVLDILEGTKITSAAHTFKQPGLRYIISQTGQIWTPDDTEAVAPMGEILTAETKTPSANETYLPHTEGEAEDPEEYHAAVFLAWDIKNSIPVKIILSGQKGLLGEKLRLNFSFVSDLPSTTPFPLIHSGEGETTTDWSEDRKAVKTTQTVPLENNQTWKRHEIHHHLGSIPFEGSNLTVWVSNDDWNTSEIVEM